MRLTRLFAVACVSIGTGSVAGAAAATTAPTEPTTEATSPTGSTESTGSTGSSASAAGPARSDVTLTLVAYDSFPTADTDLNAALDAFTDETGIGVEVLSAGDTGEMVTKAVLTAGNPEGDVMFGVDTSFLGRAIAGKIFEPHASAHAGDLRDGLAELTEGDEVTPVDIGDVCINSDVAWFADHDLEPPATLDDLTKEEYADLLVVEDPAVSSPGMGFVLATIAHFGEDDWLTFWGDLANNGVKVAENWTTAYYDEFSATGSGSRPLVVSYATSPAAELVFADPPVDEAPTAVMTSSCFRLVEFAGVLAGTEHPDEAGQLVDFLSGPEFQGALPLTNFVVPANGTVELPAEFEATDALPSDPLTMTPDEIDAGRDAWIEEWTETMGR